MQRGVRRPHLQARGCVARRCELAGRETAQWLSLAVVVVVVVVFSSSSSSRCSSEASTRRRERVTHWETTGRPPLDPRTSKRSSKESALLRAEG